MIVLINLSRSDTANSDMFLLVWLFSCSPNCKCQPRRFVLHPGTVGISLGAPGCSTLVIAKPQFFKSSIILFTT